MRCPNPNCGAIVTGKKCWNCGTVCDTVDPETKLRRRIEYALRLATPEKRREVAAVLGVK